MTHIMINNLKKYGKTLATLWLLLGIIGGAGTHMALAADGSSDGDSDQADDASSDSAQADDGSASEYGARTVNENAYKSYVHGMKMINVEKYSKAAKSFRKAVKKDRNNADLWNMLGYSLRQAGDYPEALTAYSTALSLDSEHLGALEYLGELYIQTGERNKALGKVAKLEELCPTGCKELTMLQKALNK